MVNVLKAKSYTLNFSEKTFVMGILNVTPDSFSDGGRFNEIEAAVKHAKKLAEDGADIIDIGGESTRPGYTKVTAEEELARVVPIIKAVKGAVDLPISIDTYKAETARGAIEAGADIINDIWGAKADPEMAKVAARYDVPIILMHNRDNTDYRDLIPDVLDDLRESVKIVKEAGVKDENILVDPGIGFAKTFEQNLLVMRNLSQLKQLGYPILLGTSRKSMIGNVLDLPVDQRVEGTGATVCYGIQAGSDIVRVHDVKEMSRMTRMMDAMIGKGQWRDIDR